MTTTTACRLTDSLLKGATAWHRATLVLLALVACLCVQAQMADPVKFTTRLKTDGSAHAEIVFTGKIDPGWHVYSTALGNDGPVSATFGADALEGAETDGPLKAVGKEKSSFDKLFGMTLRFFEGSVEFVQPIRFTAPHYRIKAYLEYGACNDQNCLPPTQVDFSATGKSPAMVAPKGGKPEPAATDGDAAGAKADDAATLAPDSPAVLPLATDTAEVGQASVGDPDVWAPVTAEIGRMGGEAAQVASRPMVYILLMGFVGGLLAMVMPCIWPIIPMTVSFFLKRARDDRRRGLRDAVLYGLSIVVIYLAMGLGVTALFGPSTLNALSTNAVFNMALFLLLVVFALSFFGWFEIRLPQGWANRVDSRASRTSGLVSIFLMAFTLVLVSFSCTAPIIGLLLAETVTSGRWLAPAVGMLGFALALAVPFTLFALFPTLMKKSPRGGAWMNQVKVVLGFVELAFSLKFFSVADMAYGWHLLDREVFLSLWIVIFFALGCYLVGWLRFPSDDVEAAPHKAMPVPAVMAGLVSMAFAVYMLPGLWGAPCKAVSAFAPPMSTQDFNLNTSEVKARFTDYDEAMAAARREGKPVLVDFTGFGCVNCRKMEAAVWTDASVARILQDDYVLVSLFVDDKTPLPKPVEVMAGGRKRTLRTVGDKWSYLQTHKFGANTQPFYVAVDVQGHPLVAPYSYDESVDDYRGFLNRGLKTFKERNEQQ